MRANFDTAMQVLSENPEDDMNIEQIMNLMHQEKPESIVSFIYQTNSKVIKKQSYSCLQEACPKKKFLGKSTRKKLKLVVTHKLASNDQELHEVALSKIVCIQLNGFLKQFIDFEPFDKTVENITNNLNLFCQDWNLEPEVLKKALKDIQTLVHRPIPIKFAIKSVLKRESYKSSNHDVMLDFLNAHFAHLFIKKNIHQLL